MPLVTPKHKNNKHAPESIPLNDDDLAAGQQSAIFQIARYSDIETLSESEVANFVDTPVRAAKAWKTLNYSSVPNLNIKAKTQIASEVTKILETGFPAEGGDCGIVTQGPIESESVCPHHLLPVYYHAYVAYKPTTGGTLLGLSKLARLVKELSSRPILQEQLTADIADCLFYEKPGHYMKMKPESPLSRVVGVYTNLVYESSPGVIESMVEKRWAVSAKYFDQIVSDGSAVQLIGKHSCMSCRGVNSNALTLTTVLRGQFSSNNDLKNEFYQAVSALRDTKI